MKIKDIGYLADARCLLVFGRELNQYELVGLGVADRAIIGRFAEFDIPANGAEIEIDFG